MNLSPLESRSSAHLVQVREPPDPGVGRALGCLSARDWKQVPSNSCHARNPVLSGSQFWVSSIDQSCLQMGPSSTKYRTLATEGLSSGKSKRTFFDDRKVFAPLEVGFLRIERDVVTLLWALNDNGSGILDPARS